MREIVLAGGLIARIDDSDFDLADRYSWCACRSGKIIYAATKIRRDGRRRNAFLHRLLLNARADMVVDHVDGDGLNNCRSNLRLATRSQNRANTRIRRGGARFKGVYPYGAGRYAANITFRGKTRFLGSFDTAEEAARAFDAAAKEIHGEFAGLNFGE